MEPPLTILPVDSQPPPANRYSGVVNDDSAGKKQEAM